MSLYTIRKALKGNALDLEDIEKKIDTATRSTSPHRNACATPSRDYSEYAAW